MPPACTQSHPSDFGLRTHPQTPHPQSHHHRGCAVVHSHTLEAPFALLFSDTEVRRSASTQKQSKQNKHLPRMKSKCPVRLILNPESPQLFPRRPMLRQLPFFPLLIMKQVLRPLLWAGPSQPGVGGAGGQGEMPGAQAAQREEAGSFKVTQGEHGEGTREGKKPPEFLPHTERSHLH